MSMKERDREKFLARQAAEKQEQERRRLGRLWATQRATPAQIRRARRLDHASRAEQHGRYLDCGPQAWDDR